MDTRLGFVARVWLHPGPGGWHFATLPQDLSKRVRTDFGGLNQGWGSLPVEATIGTSRWSTSLFPDSKSGCYLLPLKAAIRSRERIGDGDEVEIHLDFPPRA